VVPGDFQSERLNVCIPLTRIFLIPNARLAMISIASTVIQELVLDGKLA
jgi:hypothetical protein